MVVTYARVYKKSAEFLEWRYEGVILELEGEVWVMRIGRRRMMMIRRRMRRKMEECEDYLVLSARWRRWVWDGALQRTATRCSSPANQLLSNISKWKIKIFMFFTNISADIERMRGKALRDREKQKKGGGGKEITGGQLSVLDRI